MQKQVQLLMDEAKKPKQIDLFYTCDPNKNIKCSKESCCSNGITSDCTLTSDFRYAKRYLETDKEYYVFKHYCDPEDGSSISIYEKIKK